jgi:hypothetical protein
MDSHSVFFMPHCPLALYDNCLTSNFTPRQLSNITLIGNDLSYYAMRMSSKQLEARAPSIARLVLTDGITEIRSVDTSHLAESNTRMALNDLSIHSWRHMNHTEHQHVFSVALSPPQQSAADNNELV